MASSPLLHGKTGNRGTEEFHVGVCIWEVADHLEDMPDDTLTGLLSVRGRQCSVYIPVLTLHDRPGF